jgi:hypothetical protein
MAVGDAGTAMEKQQYRKILIPTPDMDGLSDIA